MMNRQVRLLAAILLPVLAASLYGSGISDDLPTSVVMWVCPDEPFSAAIGKPRYYRRTFETKDGLVNATARWWVDDTGTVFVDGEKMPYSAMMVDKAADLTAQLKKPGRHVISVEGTNLAAAGGVCVSIDLEYADGRLHTSSMRDLSTTFRPKEDSPMSFGFRQPGQCRFASTHRLLPTEHDKYELH